MNEINRSVKIASLVLIAIGVILLVVNIVSGGRLNIALPLLFLVLGISFFILVFSLRQKWLWAYFLYIPALILTTLGFIFLLNVLTSDWRAWAYAWLLLLAAIGIGLLLANRPHIWHPVLNIIGWGLTIAGFTFFGIFGAITGGLFIQIVAPFLLIVAGVSIRWLHFENILPESILSRLRSRRKNQKAFPGSQPVEALVDPLSNRELEVLSLIADGFSNQEIARRISIAPSTVKTHINNIYGKLGVQTRLQAAKRAHDLGLIKKPSPL